MPVDLSKLVDPNDLADDDVRAIPERDLRDRIYRVTEKLKEVLNSNQVVLAQLNAEIVALGKRVTALEP